MNFTQNKVPISELPKAWVLFFPNYRNTYIAMNNKNTNNT
jgi:hypothetical protein